MKPDLTYRPYLTPEGKRRLDLVEFCECADRRGRRGDTCGRCGKAIPSDRELEAYADVRKREDARYVEDDR